MFNVSQNLLLTSSGSGQGIEVIGTVGGASSGQIDLTIPAGTASTDLMVAMAQRNSSTSTLPLISGWQRVAEGEYIFNNTTPPVSNRFCFYYRLPAASPPSTLSLPSSGSNQRLALIVLRRAPVYSVYTAAAFANNTSIGTPSPSVSSVTGGTILFWNFSDSANGGGSTSISVGGIMKVEIETATGTTSGSRFWNSAGSVPGTITFN